jgi:DNA-binding response OmpR family regulator
MPLTVVLAVGLDPWLLTAHTRDCISAGYFVVSAYSIVEAIDLFNGGDFDLVVLGDSVSMENRQKLTSLIRASGSQTPVTRIGNSSAAHDSLSDAPLKNDSSTLVTELRELLLARLSCAAK